MEQAQFDQIMHAYLSNPRNRAELNHSHLTVFVGKAPWLRVLPAWLLLVVTLAGWAIIFSVGRYMTGAVWLLALVPILLTFYVVRGMVTVLLLARSSLTIDLATGEATAKTFRGSKPQRRMNLADGISFAGMTLKDFNALSRAWFPIHCISTTVTNGRQQMVFLLPFATVDDYNAFAPVLDALLRRYSRVVVRGAIIAR